MELESTLTGEPGKLQEPIPPALRHRAVGVAGRRAERQQCSTNGNGSDANGHEPAGRQRLGALLAEMADGTKFAVGTGFSDAELEARRPSAARSRFTLSRVDGQRAPVPVVRRLAPGRGYRGPTGTGEARRQRWDCHDSKQAALRVRRWWSHKFWEISVSGQEVTVRFGRNGTNEQSNVKNFADGARPRSAPAAGTRTRTIRHARKSLRADHARTPSLPTCTSWRPRPAGGR